jgi:dTDP-4-dehydrorhamnose reductase
MNRIVITGASGLLGLNIGLQYADQIPILGITNQSNVQDLPFETIAMDLITADFEKEILDVFQPKLVINCAAMANLDQCEKNPEQAMKINAFVPGKLASACRQRGIKFVHISTDAVFDGTEGNYLEEDLPNPLSVYAKTKLSGEQEVIRNNPEAIIARVNFFGWSLSGKRSLSEFFFNNLSDKKQINGFTDVLFCPLYVTMLAEFLMEMARHNLSGVYHVASSDFMSKYEFGCAIADQFGFDRSLIKPISVNQSELVATRSLNLTLSTEKLSRDLNLTVPTVRDGIKLFYQDYLNSFSNQIQGYASV